MHTTHITYQLEFLSILLEVSSGNTFVTNITPVRYSTVARCKAPTAPPYIIKRPT